MTKPNIALSEYFRDMGLDTQNADFIKQALQVMVQQLIEVELSERIKAGRYERTAERTTQRNGHRERGWETRVGEIPLDIPKVRQGSFFPSLLEPRRRSEKALTAVIQSAYVEGVSTRKVDSLVKALGLDGIDKSAVSRLCQDLDQMVEQFRNQALEGSHPYLWLDAVYLKARINHRVVSRALVIGIGVRETGEREIVGFALGNSEEEAFWQEFLRSLVQRGLNGVQLVISDAHEGLKAALVKVLVGSTWQRCRVHFMRNLLAHIPQVDKSVVAALVRTIFAQPDRPAAHAQLGEVARMMQSKWPDAARLLLTAEEDILAYMAFPPDHWTRIYSTNPLERLNREVKRRADVVQVFPDDQAVLRLIGSVLLEIADDWAADPKHYFSLSSIHQLFTPHVAWSGTPAPKIAPAH